MTRPKSNMRANYPRIAIVTGATSGIGEAIARKLIAGGFGVVGTGRNLEKLHELERQLGAAFWGVAGDASDDAILEQLFAEAIGRFGKPADIVIASAGRGLGGSVTDADLCRFEDMLKLNVTAVLALLQKAANRMIAMQHDRYPDRAADIVIIGSVVGRHVSPFSAAYGATKFAVHGLTEGLRREVGPKGVRVTLVEPAVVVSGFQQAAGYGDDLLHTFNEKFGPLLHGEDIANAIHYVVTQPPHVHVSDIVIRPTRQDYP